MDKNININLQLIIMSCNYDGEVYILNPRQTNYLWSTRFTDGGLKRHVTSLIFLDYEWLAPKLIDVYNEDNNVVRIVYAIVIPKDTKINGHLSWYKVSEYTASSTLLQSIYKAIQKL